jgi:hypothetical protein
MDLCTPRSGAHARALAPIGPELALQSVPPGTWRVTAEIYMHILSTPACLWLYGFWADLHHFLAGTSYEGVLVSFMLAAPCGLRLRSQIRLRRPVALINV